MTACPCQGSVNRRGLPPIISKPPGREWEAWTRWRKNRGPTGPTSRQAGKQRAGQRAAGRLMVVGGQCRATVGREENGTSPPHPAPTPTCHSPCPATLPRRGGGCLTWPPPLRLLYGWHSNNSQANMFGGGIGRTWGGQAIHGDGWRPCTSLNLSNEEKKNGDDFYSVPFSNAANDMRW